MREIYFIVAMVVLLIMDIIGMAVLLFRKKASVITTLYQIYLVTSAIIVLCVYQWM